MIARAVIGANFGDEGKGVVTDYLCSQGAGVVVRFNGGAQSGHTVVTPNGSRHVFSHFGSGSFLNVPTYLSQYFTCNPILFLREMDTLQRLGVTPVIYAHPDCLVTTFVDMMINQHMENKRGKDRHGSVGLGVNETFERSQVHNLKITMADLWNHSPRIKSRLDEICTKYAEFRAGITINEPDMTEAFIKACWAMADNINPAGISQCVDPVFEGGQGLLLDMDNKEFFPHLTRSKTGMHNVRVLCAQAKIDKIETYYVSRAYLTRHGAGKLPREDRALSYADNTNLEHAYQGKLRFAPLEYESLWARCNADYESPEFRIALTHCDQVAPKHHADLYFYGPTREDASTVINLSRAEQLTSYKQSRA